MTALPTFIGIDPAPTKTTVAYDGDSFHEVAPEMLREWLEARRESAKGGIVVAWDAPLALDPEYRCPRRGHFVGFYRRRFDDVARKWAEGQDRLQDKAVNVGHLGGLPHWIITCEVLGHPFGESFAPLLCRPEDFDGRAGLIEVHPAFSLAVWWLADESVEDHFPRYKSGYKSDQQSARELIVDRLGYLDIPVRCAGSDDYLDAWAGWRMARDFWVGDAIWAGNPDFGAYVLPATCREVGPFLND